MSESKVEQLVPQTDAEEVNDVVDELINPEIKTMVIGTRTTRSVQVYPLGYYDQKEIGTAVLTGISEAAKDADVSSEIEYISKLSQVLEDNVPALITKCTDLTRKKFMSDITSGQLMEFITIIMEVNFMNPIKKGTRLFVEMGSLYGGSQSLPVSADTTDIPSEISD